MNRLLQFFKSYHPEGSFLKVGANFAPRRQLERRRELSFKKLASDQFGLATLELQKFLKEAGHQLRAYVCITRALTKLGAIVN
jgi:hypothetical protein